MFRLLGSITFGALAVLAVTMLNSKDEEEKREIIPAKKPSAPKSRPVVSAKREVNKPAIVPVKPKAPGARSLPKKNQPVTTHSSSFKRVPSGVTARQQMLMEMLASGSPVALSSMARNFPEVNVRTIRRDMDKLEARGLVVQRGTTRSTVYVRK